MGHLKGAHGKARQGEKKMYWCEAWRKEFIHKLRGFGRVARSITLH